MKTPFIKSALLAAAALACGAALAQQQEIGRVLSSTPIIQQVAVAREVCTIEQGQVQQPRSGAGAIMGAIAGGAMGNAVGDGGGRAAATIIGIIGGAILGDRVEHAGPPTQQPIRQCTTQHIYEPRTTAYSVVYEYAGKQYSVQLPYDPGPTIRLQITPVGVGSSSLEPHYAPPATVISTAPVYQTYSTYSTYSTSPVYVLRPYYPPLTLHLGYGYWGGHRHRHNWR